jgi:hypothetical protein
MKKSLGVVCLSMLGALLATGCGSAQAEEPRAQAGSVAAESAEPSASIAPEQDDSGLGQEGAAGTQTQAVGQCCHVKCADGLWRGPFSSVTYNHCPEYGKYYCPAHKLGAYVSSTWRGC